MVLTSTNVVPPLCDPGLPIEVFTRLYKTPPCSSIPSQLPFISLQVPYKSHGNVSYYYWFVV